MDSLWGCQQLLQHSAACTATAASATAGAPISDFQTLFNEWGGTLQGNSGPAMPPSPQTMKDNRLGAAAAAAAAEPPGSPNHMPHRINSTRIPSFKASPKTSKASRKAYQKDEPEADSCRPTLGTFAGRYGFTVTTTNTCISYSNARCSHEIVLENSASAPKADEAMAVEYSASPADEPVISPSTAEPPAALKAVAAGNMVLPAVLPSPAADNNLMLPPMPRLPFTALLSQASFQQPATPAAATAPQRLAAAASPQCSPAFFRTVSTGMPAGLLHSNSSAHESQTLGAAAAAAAATTTDYCHQADHAQHRAAAPAPPGHTSSPNFMSDQAWDGGVAAQTHNSPHINPLQQLSNYLQSLPNLAGELQQQQQQQQQSSCIMQQHLQQPARAAWTGSGGLQAQAVAVFGSVGPLDDKAPAGAIINEAATPAAAMMMPPDWSLMQSMDLDFEFDADDATQQYLATHQQRQQQQVLSTRNRTTSPKPGSPSKGKKDSSPSKTRKEGSPSRHNSSGSRQQCGASAAYQQILRRRLRRPRSRGPRYDPSVKTAAAAAARYGTGASLLGKHRLSNCSSMEDGGAVHEGMPHEWAGSTTLDLNELDSWDDEALASGCLGEGGSMEIAASLGLEGFEGYVWPLDSSFPEEDGLQLQQPMYTCTPAAAAAAAAAGMVPGARRASSMSSDWFRELGVQDIAGNRRCSLFNDCMSVNTPVAIAQPLLAAVAGSGIKYFRCSDAEVDSEVQRGLAYRPVWGVQACVGQVGKQCLIDGGVTPDMFYDGPHQDS